MASSIKPLLCYHCALRMSTMFCVPPPPARHVVLASSSAVSQLEPTVLRDVNTVFDIVYESEASSLRMLRSVDGGDINTPDITANSVFEFLGSDVQRSNLFQHLGKTLTCHPQPHKATTVCVACCGLYQFLDEIYAPVAAAIVRASPYLDSTEVATNINCPRSMAFVWLAAAVEYRRGVAVPPSPADDVDHATVPAATGPSPTAIIPEEFSNFRDFYMGDVRNRVLRFLTSAGLQDGVAAPRSDIPGAALYQRVLEHVVARRAAQRAAAAAATKEAASTLIASDQGEGSRKRARDDVTPAAHLGPPFEDHNIPKLCSQALRFAALGTNGISIDLDATLPTCYDHLAVPERYSGVMQKGSTNRGGFESIVPTQYGSNKSGAVMMYSVVYDYVMPYMKQNHLGPYSLRSSDIEGASSEERRCGVVLHVTHSNVFLLGLYRKMLRSLSQSPWFCEGERIGTYSLQELIAEPFLRVAFPYGIPPGVVPTNTARRQERTTEYLSTLTAQEAEQHQYRSAAGAAHRQHDKDAPSRPSHHQGSGMQEKDPCEASLENVVGYGWYKFHSAGREDVDVRMLGTGRPYVLELVAPHRQTFSASELADLEAEVNESPSGGVESSSLRYTTTDITVQLARHSESKTKTYRCVVWCSRAITSANDEGLRRVNAMKDLSVVQRTPLRVLHRRSLLDRPKIIHGISCERVNDHWLVVDLETQAGTYVKEFIHGDNGRTSPSLGELLGGRTDIIQLDVLGMTLPTELYDESGDATAAVV
jgi:tRNA pseudouridine synthase 10